jgi:hypothetical protein
MIITTLLLPLGHIPFTPHLQNSKTAGAGAGTEPHPATRGIPPGREQGREGGTAGEDTGCSGSGGGWPWQPLTGKHGGEGGGAGEDNSGDNQTTQESTGMEGWLGGRAARPGPPRAAIRGSDGDGGGGGAGSSGRLEVTRI